MDIINFLRKKIVKYFLLIFSGNIFGKITGILREVLLAFYFGISNVVGAFRIAQSAVLIPIHFFTSDILNAGFLPLYTIYLKKNRQKAAFFYWVLKISIIFISILLMIIIFYNSYSWVSFLALGFKKEDLLLTSSFVQILSFSVPFYFISALFNYLSMANKDYTLIAIRASIQNIGILCGTLFAYYLDNILFLAYGFLTSYIIFFLVSLKEVIKKKYILRFTNLNTKSKKIILLRFFKIIKPLLLLPFILQGNIIVEKMVSSLISINVVASIDYAKFISETLILLLAVPLGLISLSSYGILTKIQLQKKVESLVIILFIISIPLTLYFSFYSELIVKILFFRGAFDTTSLKITSLILLGLSIGLCFQIVSYVLIKVLNARLQNRKVLKYMAISLFFNAFFNLLFFKFFGAITIGFGVSVYGFILSILTMNYFHILFSTIKELFLFIPLGILYLFLSNFFNLENDCKGLFLSLIFFISYWGIFIFLIPNFKQSIKSIKGLK